MPTIDPNPSNDSSPKPTVAPSLGYSRIQSVLPSTTTAATLTDIPSIWPSADPLSYPSNIPSVILSASPSARPSAKPEYSPSLKPTNIPSVIISDSPSANPSTKPSHLPSLVSSSVPSAIPSNKPSSIPSISPSSYPSVESSSGPSHRPSNLPSSTPSNMPSPTPTTLPSVFPTISSSALPSLNPSNKPSAPPSLDPSVSPITKPSSYPTGLPSLTTSMNPSLTHSSRPTAYSSLRPTALPSSLSSSKPYKAIINILFQSHSPMDDIIKVKFEEVTLHFVKDTMKSIKDAKVRIISVTVDSQFIRKGGVEGLRQYSNLDRKKFRRLSENESFLEIQLKISGEVSANSIPDDFDFLDVIIGGFQTNFEDLKRRLYNSDNNGFHSLNEMDYAAQTQKTKEHGFLLTLVLVCTMTVVLVVALIFIAMLRRKRNNAPGISQVELARSGVNFFQKNGTNVESSINHSRNSISMVDSCLSDDFVDFQDEQKKNEGHAFSTSTVSCPKCTCVVY